MKTKVIAICALLTMIAATGMAQESGKRFGLELTANGLAATSDYGNASLSAGMGSELNIHYRFMPHLGAYAGWSWNKFSSDQSFAGTDMDFEETGYNLGLQFNHPLGISTVSYFVRAGGTWKHLEIENEDGDIISDSGHGLGWQVSAGLEIPLNTRLSLVPGAKYSSLSRDVTVDGVKTSSGMNYVSMGAGIVWKF